MRLIDGMPGIFKETFGVETIYTPKATGVPIGTDGKITAIWIERASEVATGEAATDTREVELHVDRADVPDPQEGDLAQRVVDGKTMRIVPPIWPDDQGMILCALELAPLPGSIADLVASADGSDIELAFTAATDADAHEYRFALAGAGIWSAPATLSGDTVSGLAPATPYDFQVRGVNDVGPGPWSNTATAATL